MLHVYASIDGVLFGSWELMCLSALRLSFRRSSDMRHLNCGVLPAEGQAGAIVGSRDCDVFSHSGSLFRPRTELYLTKSSHAYAVEREACAVVRPASFSRTVIAGGSVFGVRTIYRDRDSDECHWI